MHSKVVFLLLATLQVSYSSQWKGPHIRYYSRWAKYTHPDSIDEDRLSGSSEDDFHHRLLKHGCRCWDHSSNDIKPIYEDQHEDVPRRRGSSIRQEESHIDGYDSLNGPNHVFLLGKPRHGDEVFVNPIHPPYGDTIDKPDECEIFVNPIRPPNEGSINNKPLTDDVSVHSGISIRPAPELVSEGGLREEHRSNAATVPGEILNSPLGSSVSRGLTNEYIQESIANSAVREQIRAAALRATASPVNSLIPESLPIGFTPILPFLPSGVKLPCIEPTGISPPIQSVSATLTLPPLPAPNVCIRHRLVPVPVRVVEECISNVPVVRKTVHHQVETVTSHIPVTERTVMEQQEKIVRQVPISGKTLRNVVETRVRHIPVIKSRTRTVVEPYTVHIPVKIRFTRPVEESITKIVPVQEFRTRPIVTSRTRLVPIVERRLRPIVEEQIQNVPVKKQYQRTVVEQRVRPVIVRCQPCDLPTQPIGLPLSSVQAQDIPRFLLSPFSDLGGAPVSVNSPLQAAVSRGPLSSKNIVLSGPINSQILASCNLSGDVSSQIGIEISANPDNVGNAFLPSPINGEIVAPCGDHPGLLSLSTSAGTAGEIGIPSNAHHNPHHLHDRSCAPPPPSC